MSDAQLENARRAHELGNLPEAARLYAEILRADAKNFDALYALGVVHYDCGGFEDARRLLAEAVRLNPRSAPALFAHGRALQRLNRHGQALEVFDLALELEPTHAGAALSRANALLALHRNREAIACYDRYLAAHPDAAEAWHNRGVAQSGLKRFKDAVPSFAKALDLRPDSAESWHNRGNAHSELQDFEAAVHDHERALALDPDLPEARGHLVFAKLSACDWRGLEAERKKLAAALRARQPAIVPFGSVMISDSPSDQLQCAQGWIARRNLALPPLWRGERYDHERIRVAYVSGDFRTHPVAILIAGVFEHHDRERFETAGISIGPDDGSEIRARIAAGFERFIDARGKSDLQIASLLREMEVDVAIDLMGLTADCRPGIFALRPAPVQVNYLGYPGTMGAPFMDYIFADAVVIPEHGKHHYSEKVVYLPDTYLASDDKRPIAPVPSRAEAGLPEYGFVFCSFNQTYKFTPEMFAVWMRLLGAAEGSVLWLPEGNEAARRNLARAAEEHGVARERLIFAPHLLSAEQHLGRLSLADLFLDTLPCNAHSTASDALWAGLPLITCMGSTFAGRVAASLLGAIGLPELVTESIAAYEAMALLLARDAGPIGEIKAKLARNRNTAPLFDTARFTRNLEAAFAHMRERAKRGEAPQSFAVRQPSQ